jgi:hypothetical protein
LVLPFFREPSRCEKDIFLQGKFSSILTKCPSHLILACDWSSRENYRNYSNFTSRPEKVVLVYASFQRQVALALICTHYYSTRDMKSVWGKYMPLHSV